MITVPCIYCDTLSPVKELLGRVHGYTSVTGVFVAVCGHCAKDQEFRIRGGHITAGYTYWAGSPHFEGVDDITVRGLWYTESDKEKKVVIHYKGVDYPVANYF